MNIIRDKPAREHTKPEYHKHHDYSNKVKTIIFVINHFLPYFCSLLERVMECQTTRRYPLRTEQIYILLALTLALRTKILNCKAQDRTQDKNKK
jgi:hypothetical protein